MLAFRGHLLIILQGDTVMGDDDALIRAPGCALGDLPHPFQIFLPNCDLCHFSPPDLATNQIALNFDRVPNDVHNQTDTFARAGIRHRGPHGVNIDAIRDSLTAALGALSYEAFPIHLTKEMLKAHQYQLQKFPVEDPSERKFLC